VKNELRSRVNGKRTPGNVTNLLMMTSMDKEGAAESRPREKRDPKTSINLSDVNGKGNA
jgi:hypothetical protein